MSSLALLCFECFIKCLDRECMPGLILVLEVLKQQVMVSTNSAD